MPEILFEEACAWFARLASDDVGNTDRQAFRHWLASSPAHAQAWREAQTLYAALETPARAAREPSRRAFHGPTGLHRRAAGRGLSGLYAKAAAVLLLTLSAGTLWQPHWVQNLRSDHYTAVGQQQSILLADGSRVLLNTDTAVTVDLDKAMRRVVLLRGEAFFQVALSPGRPFRVEAGVAQARVTGTAFSVGKSDDDITIAVLEGRVEASSERPETSAIPVTAGESVRFRENHLEALGSTDITRALAWRNGQLVFVQTPLWQVLEQINRYRRGRIILTNQAMRDRPVTAVFSIEHLSDALSALQQTFGLRAARFTDLLILLS